MTTWHEGEDQVLALSEMQWTIFMSSLLLYSFGAAFNGVVAWHVCYKPDSIYL